MEGNIDSSLNRIIDIVRSQLPLVKGIYLFGSYADKTQKLKSDIDIAVHVKGGISGDEKLKLATEFVKALGVQIDMLDFENASTITQYEIISQGRLIFDGDTDFNDNTYLKTLGIYFDYLIETRDQRHQIKKRRKVYG